MQQLANVDRCLGARAVRVALWSVVVEARQRLWVDLRREENLRLNDVRVPAFYDF